MSRSFGDGFQSQLLLVAQTPNAQARTAWASLVHELPTVKGVASVSAPIVLRNGTLSYVDVTPTTTSQAQATTTLVNSLRSTSIKRAEVGTDLQVHVGGVTASTIDYANALAHKLPLFLAIIAGLGFLLLMLAFRSLLIPLFGAIGNVLTIGVALGATVALFQWGWGPTLFGVGGPAPLEYVVAILIMGVVFGLSMDYHVFMVSRMHEEWTESKQNKRAIAVGIKETGPVILTAAGIMACVFASFGLSGMRVTAEFGVGLAVAVLVDVLFVRMTLLPAVMSLCGGRNWAVPSWLDRVLPHFSMEGVRNRGRRGCSRGYQQRGGCARADRGWLVQLKEVGPGHPEWCPGPRREIRSADEKDVRAAHSEVVASPLRGGPHRSPPAHHADWRLSESPDRMAGELLLVALAWLPLTVRNRWPALVLAVVAVVDTVSIGIAGQAHPPSAILPASTMLALYTVSNRWAGRRAWGAGAAVGIVQFVVAVATTSDLAGDFLYLNWAVIAVAIGQVVQERRAKLAAADQRAMAAEQSKDAEAQRRVIAERMRIARELHDVLAHHIAVVNAQAGVAQYLLETDPAAASKALSGITTNSRAALDELRMALGLLRGEDDAEEQGERFLPTPTIEHLDSVVEGTLSKRACSFRLIFVVLPESSALLQSSRSSGSSKRH